MRLQLLLSMVVIAESHRSASAPPHGVSRRQGTQGTTNTCSGKDGNKIPEGAPTDCWTDMPDGDGFCLDYCGCHRDEVPLTVAMYKLGRSVRKYNIYLKKT